MGRTQRTSRLSKSIVERRVSTAKRCRRRRRPDHERRDAGSRRRASLHDRRARTRRGDGGDRPARAHTRAEHRADGAPGEQVGQGSADGDDGAPPAKDAGTPPAKPEKKKRDRKKRHSHGRPNLAHLPRVLELHEVPSGRRVCPKCGVEAATIGVKTTLQLDIEPARYVAREIKRQRAPARRATRTLPRHRRATRSSIAVPSATSCSCKRSSITTTPLCPGNARQQGPPLSANTLASSVGRVIDRTRCTNPTSTT